MRFCIAYRCSKLTTSNCSGETLIIRKQNILTWKGRRKCLHVTFLISFNILISSKSESVIRMQFCAYWYSLREVLLPLRKVKELTSQWNKIRVFCKILFFSFQPNTLISHVLEFIQYNIHCNLPPPKNPHFLHILMVLLKDSLNKMPNKNVS